MLGWLRQHLSTAGERAHEPSPAATQALILIEELVSRISVPESAAAVLEKVRQFREASVSKQEKLLPAVYLLLEQFLAEVDPLQKYARRELRELVRQQYTSLFYLEDFHLIFQPEQRQEVLLCRDLLRNVLQRAAPLVGGLEEALAWIQCVPEEATFPLPLNLQAEIPQTDKDWLPLLRRLSLAVYQLLEKNLGERPARRIYESGYEDLAETFIGLEVFPAVIVLLPEKILDEQKLSLLNYRQMQRALIDNVDLLREMNTVLLQKNVALQEAQDQLIMAREAAQESSTQFRSVLDTVAEGIFTFDANGRIVLINRAVQNIWGYEPEEVAGAAFEKLIAPEYAFQLWPIPGGYELMLRPGFEAADILGQRVEVAGVTKSGERFPLEMRITETKIGDRFFFTAAVSDITERKRAEQTMEQALDLALESSDLKSRLLATIGHDLRTPLTSIIGYAELLKRGHLGELADKQQNALARILKGGKQMAALLDDLLKQAQMERDGQLVLQPDLFQPEELLDNMQAAVGLSAQMKGLALTTEIGPQVPDELVGDRQRLQQILNNLVNNAVKFTDVGGVHVTIGRPDDAHWTLSVADTGMGIPPDAQRTIFEPFQRAALSAVAKREGIGLGLSIVKQLVALMEGEIALESQEGQGSTFTITLPLAGPNAAKNN